jgi:hypothetical protein
VYICNTVNVHIYNAELVNVGTAPPIYFGSDDDTIDVLDVLTAETSDA